MVRTPIEKLASDPWFQLSTAGQELFHTNMLYWLAKHRWDESRPVWELLAPKMASHGRPRDVLREKRHTDLILDAGKNLPFMVLENKVSAIPSRIQLEKYKSDLKKEYPQERPGDWTLLSNVDPHHDRHGYASPDGWQHVSYRDLNERLGEIRLHGGEASLLKGYRRLLDRLLCLSDHFQAMSDEDFKDQSYFVDDDLSQRARDGRVLTLIEKMRMSKLAALIQSALQIDRPEVVPGLTRSIGLIEFFADSSEGIQFGWQIQGKQFRLAARCNPDEREQRGDAITRLKRIEAGAETVRYFDHLNELEGMIEKRTGKPWCRYSDKSAGAGESSVNFLYKYRKIPRNHKIGDIVKVATRMARHAMAFCEEQRKVNRP